MVRKIVFIGFLFLFLACSETVQEDGTSKTTPELDQALNILNRIDPQVDTVDEIIAQYKEAKKILSKKVGSGTASLEEKYVYFLADSFLLFHQLINLLNEIAKAVIAGKFDQQTIVNIIQKLPQAPYAKIYTKQQDSLPYGCGDTSGLAQSLCSVMNSIFLERLEYDIRILREIQSEAESKGIDLRINIKSLPVKVQLIVLNYSIDFGGEHDLGLVYFFESALDLIDALFRFIFSVNIDLLNGTFDIPNYLQGVSITEDILLHGGRILTHLLKKNLSAFSVASVVELGRTREQILQSIDKVQKFLNYVKDKNADSKTTLLYYDTGENQYGIRYKLNGELKEVLFLKQSDARVFQSATEKIRKNFEGSVQYISTQDLIYMTATVLVSSVKTGLLDPILDVAIGFLGSEQSELIRQVMDSQLFTPGTLAGLLGGILGDVFYFDFGTAFRNLEGNKTKYREWLPAWTVYLGDFKDNFVVEWDCGAKLYDDSITQYKEGRSEFFGLSCTQPEQDIEHFSSVLTTSISFESVQGWGSYPNALTIDKDGVSSDFPYILFQDPSFGGFLLIKGSSLQNFGSFLQACGVDTSAAPKSYFDSRKAGNCALNAALQSIIGNILSALSGV